MKAVWKKTSVSHVLNTVYYATDVAVTAAVQDQDVHRHHVANAQQPTVAFAGN